MKVERRDLWETSPGEIDGPLPGNGRMRVTVLKPVRARFSLPGRPGEGGTGFVISPFFILPKGQNLYSDNQFPVTSRVLSEWNWT